MTNYNYSKIAFSLLLGAVSLFSAHVSAAVPNPIPTADELPVFSQFDTQISIPSYADREIYKWIPEANGELNIYYNGDPETLFIGTTYDDEDYTVFENWMIVNSAIEDSIEGYKYGYNYQITKGATYYISLPLVNFNSASVAYFEWIPGSAESEPEGVLSVNPMPEEDVNFEYNTYTDITLWFNGLVTNFGEATLSYNEETITLKRPSQITTNVIPDKYIKLVISDLISEIAEEGAKNFTITINDVTVNGDPVTENFTENSLVTVDNGVITLTYSIDMSPVYLAEDSLWPSMFYSFWPEGDPNALAVLEFSSNIKSVDYVSVIMGQTFPGNISETEFPEYPLTPVIEGNKIILDFAGVVRLADTSTVTINIMHVVGENGLTASLGTYGTIMCKYIPYSAEEAPQDPSAITTLPESRTTGPVYNLHGVKVADSLNGLDKGIYILNGKKIILK